MGHEQTLGFTRRTGGINNVEQMVRGELQVLFGNIGVPQRLEFSVIGPAMNETARLEAMTRESGVKILTSEKFVQHLEQSMQHRELLQP